MTSSFQLPSAWLTCQCLNNLVELLKADVNESSALFNALWGSSLPEKHESPFENRIRVTDLCTIKTSANLAESKITVFAPMCKSSETGAGNLLFGRCGFLANRGRGHYQIPQPNFSFHYQFSNRSFLFNCNKLCTRRYL